MIAETARSAQVIFLPEGIPLGVVRGYPLRLLEEGISRGVVRENPHRLLPEGIPLCFIRRIASGYYFGNMLYLSVATTMP